MNPANRLNRRLPSGSPLTNAARAYTLSYTRRTAVCDRCDCIVSLLYRVVVSLLHLLQQSLKPWQLVLRNAEALAVLEIDAI
jgi:hypothetical protein